MRWKICKRNFNDHEWAIYYSKSVKEKEDELQQSIKRF